eukprot:5747876-Karenia_brevis.AAC.1
MVAAVASFSRRCREAAPTIPMLAVLWTITVLAILTMLAPSGNSLAVFCLATIGSIIVLVMHGYHSKLVAHRALPSPRGGKTRVKIENYARAGGLPT